MNAKNSVCPESNDNLSVQQKLNIAELGNLI